VIGAVLTLIGIGFVLWAVPIMYQLTSMMDDIQQSLSAVSVIKDISDSAFVVRDEMGMIYGRLEELDSSYVRSKPDSFAITINRRMDGLERELTELRANTEGLRQAINPENPEEILTIARLGDRIERLSGDLRLLKDQQMATFIKEQEDRFKAFEMAMTKLLEARSETLIPIYGSLIVLVGAILICFIQIFKREKVPAQEVAKK
jgi:vacuolar-type H+-ATPase subunit I/STV1